VCIANTGHKVLSKVEKISLVMHKQWFGCRLS